MNVFTHLASVQGYGSLISNIYDNATGTHPQASLNACHLAEGMFVHLRLRVDRHLLVAAHDPDDYARSSVPTAA